MRINDSGLAPGREETGARGAVAIADGTRIYADTLHSADALTETGRQADYVLPASSQFEKWEATFFTFEFPRNTFHLRAPVLDPLPGTLPEPEIHRRLVRALGGYGDDDLVELHAAAAAGRAAYTDAFLRVLGERPQLGRYAALVLYETFGPTLGAGNEGAAAVWGLAQTCFMNYPESVRRAGYEDGNALFDAVFTHPEGVTFTVDEQHHPLLELIKGVGYFFSRTPHTLNIKTPHHERPRHRPRVPVRPVGR